MRDEGADKVISVMERFSAEVRYSGDDVYRRTAHDGQVEDH